MTWQDILSGVLSPFLYGAQPDQRIYWLYLASALLIALIVYYLNYKTRVADNPKSIFEFCFPKRIYKHASAITDYKFFIINRIAYFFFIAPVILGSEFSSQAIESTLVTVFDQPEGLLIQSGWLATILMTIAAILAMDLAIFSTHLLQHRVPLLWEFHKVHHSAEVLTPITVYRVHPVDDLFTGSVGGLMAGAVFGVFSFIYAETPGQIGVDGLNIILFFFYFLGYNLRHTHIWLPYRGIWGKLFISPAHHQIHHGTEPKYYDRNFGFIFAFWDWSAGSLCVPERYQEIEFGLAGDEASEYHGVWQIYTLPFVKAYHRIQGWGLGQES
ncbi:MAG: sterol desaturase family protein [Alphaproteobacteria bacterium]|nr:MAG: sterol desaturase family protein [Alphaproteobacteria bacterium]